MNITSIEQLLAVLKSACQFLAQNQPKSNGPKGKWTRDTQKLNDACIRARKEGEAFFANLPFGTQDMQTDQAGLDQATSVHGVASELCDLANQAVSSHKSNMAGKVETVVMTAEAKLRDATVPEAAKAELRAIMKQPSQIIEARNQGFRTSLRATLAKNAEAAGLRDENLRLARENRSLKGGDPIVEDAPLMAARGSRRRTR